MLSLKKEELKLHQDAKVSYMYIKRLLKTFGNGKNNQKIRNHCHFTGKYRGATHIICNFKIQYAQ